MAVISFLRSRPGRVLKVGGGLWLLIYGAMQASLLGVLLMMAGVVPLVTGLAGICLFDVLLNTKPLRGGPDPRPHEHHA